MRYEFESTGTTPPHSSCQPSSAHQHHSSIEHRPHKRRLIPSISFFFCPVDTGTYKWTLLSLGATSPVSGLRHHHLWIIRHHLWIITGHQPRNGSTTTLRDVKFIRQLGSSSSKGRQGRRAAVAQIRCEAYYCTAVSLSRVQQRKNTTC